MTGFIAHFNTRLVTKLIIAPSLVSILFQLLLHTHLCSQSVKLSNDHFLVMASNSGYSSASALMPLQAGHLFTN
jgi:hypothetical protein